MSASVTPEQEASRQKRLERLATEIDEGLADLRAGRSHSLESVREDIKRLRESR